MKTPTIDLIGQNLLLCKLGENSYVSNTSYLQNRDHDTNIWSLWVVNSNSFGGTHRIVSVNYLFGMPFIPSDFLKGIVTSNFRDRRNFVCCFRIVILGSGKKKGQLSFSESNKSTQDPRFSANGQKRAYKFENIQFPLNNRTDKIFLAEPKINLQRLKCP